MTDDLGFFPDPDDRDVFIKKLEDEIDRLRNDLDYERIKNLRLSNELANLSGRK